MAGMTYFRGRPIASVPVTHFPRRFEALPWIEHAACRSHPTDLFFPEERGVAAAAEAIAVCRTCPVIDECLAYALENRSLSGVWGGTTQGQRSRRRNLRSAARSKPQSPITKGEIMNKMTATATTADVDEALRAAEYTFEALKVEADRLPRLFRDAMLNLDREAALAARRRQGEIDVDLSIAEVRLLQARIAHAEVTADRWNVEADAKRADAASVQAERDQLVTAGAPLREIELADVRVRHAWDESNRAFQMQLQANGAGARLRAKLDKKMVELGGRR